MAGPTDPPDDPAEPAATTEPDEPRARDVAAAKSTADLGERLDPKTIAQLAAWFGLPSFQQLEEERAAANAPPEPDAEHAGRLERRAKVEAVVDRELLARIEGWSTAGDEMFDPVVPPELHLVDDLVQHDPTFAERIATIAGSRDVERPQWIDEEIRESAPQAVLRDLFRAETEFPKYLTLSDPERGMVDLIRDARAPMATSYTVRPEPILPRLMAELRDETAKWKNARWEELNPPKPEQPAEKPEAPKGDDT